MHITSLILTILAIATISIAVYNLETIKITKQNIIRLALFVFTIFSSISIYDQECIMKSPCKTWGWIRFGLIILGIYMLPIIVTWMNYYNPSKP